MLSMKFYETDCPAAIMSQEKDLSWNVGLSCNSTGMPVSRAGNIHRSLMGKEDETDLLKGYTIRKRRKRRLEIWDNQYEKGRKIKGNWREDKK